MADSEQETPESSLFRVQHLVTWHGRPPGPEITHVSSNAHDLLGHDADALIGPAERFIAHVGGEQQAQLAALLQEIAPGEERAIDGHLSKPDGTRLAVRYVVFRSAEEDGAPGVLSGAIVDLSAPLAAAQALVAAESRTRAIIDTAVDGIVAIDSRGIVEWLNPAALELFGYEEHEVLGKNVSMLMPAPYFEEHDGYIANYLRTGEKKIIGIGREVQGRRKDGSTFPMDLAVGEAEVNGERLFTGIVRDITDRKQAERALQEAEARMRAIVDTAVDGIITIDEQARVQTMNPAAEAIFGYREEETLGRNVSMLMPAPYHNEHDEYVQHYLETGEKRIIGIGREVEGLRKDGSVFPMDLAVGEARVDGQRLFTGIVRDITERKRTEDALRDTQKLESLAVLAGGIAHDFNNLLVGILGNSSLALEDLPMSSPAREQIQDVQLAARRAADLARQMLAYSGRGKFVVQELHLNTLVEEMGQLLRVTIGSHAALRYNFSSSLPVVEADATQIRQVVMNLVMNASDAIGDRSGSITITTGVANVDRQYLADTVLGRDIPEGRYVSLEVSDTGEGMTPDVLARIFDPFFTTKFTGRGLGLAAVLGIVRAHKGTIRVYSEPGRGTTFKLLLPPASRDVPDPVEVVSDWNGQGAILIIDDEPSARQVAERTLRSVGFDVLGAPDGEAGLQILEREGERVRLVLLDVTMPGLSGAETYTRIRAMRSDVPVLLMSGYTEEDATSTFAGKGIAGFLQKPYMPADLRGMVRELFAGENDD